MATEKRLIDARYLTSQMYLICEVCQTENIFIDAIIDEIDNAPDVDAVEVVRCGKCKYWDPDSEYCQFWHGIRRAGYFCSEGEKKELTIPLNNFDPDDFLGEYEEENE